MAGGIDWFRWHHGSVSDQKFGLVAKKAGASVAEVIAVWACLLEAASAAANRGDPGEPDFEALDFALGLDEGKARRIYERMRERALLDPETGRIASWEKRQPKREREGDNSTERSRQFRERQREQGEATQRHATPRNANESQETPREEESREEEKGSATTTHTPTPAGRVCSAMKKAGLAITNPGHADLLALIAAGVTDEEFIGAASMAAEKGKDFVYAIGIVKRQRADAKATIEQVHHGPLPSKPDAGAAAVEQTERLLEAQASVKVDPELARQARENFKARRLTA